jgi:hypothetical protein
MDSLIEEAPPEDEGTVGVLPHVRLRFTKEIYRVCVSSTGSLAALSGRKSISVIGLAPPFAVARYAVALLCFFFYFFFFSL